MASSVGYTVYKFTQHELSIINDLLNVENVKPIHVYAWYKDLDNQRSIKSGEIEDFCYAFNTQYSRL